MSVVLPAPLGPRIPWISPASTSRLHAAERLDGAEAAVEVVDLDGGTRAGAGGHRPGSAEATRGAKRKRGRVLDPLVDRPGAIS